MRIWNTSDKENKNKDTVAASGRKKWPVMLCAILIGVFCLGMIGTLTAGGILEAMAQDNVITDTEDMDSEDGLLLLETFTEDTEIIEIIDTETEAVTEAETETASEAETEAVPETETTEDDSESATEEETGTEVRYDYTDVIEVPDVEYPYYIKVNRQANCVTVYTLDENGAYTVPIKAMVCSVGLNNATPLGVYTTSDKYEWRSLFGGTYGQYAYRITGSILFHSVPYYTTSKDALETEEYNKLGEAASLGCIRLSCIDAKWLIDNCPSGTTVEIYDDEDPGPLGKPEAITIDTDSPYAGWDPTDPDPENPWNQTEDSSEDSADEESASENSTDDETTSKGGSNSDTRVFNTPEVQVIEESVKLTTGQEDDLAELMEENLMITCEDEYRISLSYNQLREAFENHWYGTYTCMIYVHNIEDGSMATVSVEVKYLPY